MKLFNAARLFDETYRIEIPLYSVDASTRESLLESVDAISKSSFTKEQVNGMLGVVKAQAADVLTEEDCSSLLQGAVESDGTPFTITVTSENYALIYQALDQLTARIPKESEAAPVENTRVTELEAEVANLTEQITSKETEITGLQTKITELGTPTGDNAEEVTELRSKVSTLEADITTKDAAIETLRTELAGFAAFKHEAAVKEAAALAVELSRGVAKGKTFDEVCELLTPRTDESLADMIEDCKLEKAGSAETTPVEGETAPVADPTAPKVSAEEQARLDKDKLDATKVAEELYSSIEQDDEETTIYSMFLTESEVESCFGKKS